MGIHVGPQTGGVGHELPDGDAALAVGGEFRPVFGRGIVQAHPAGIHQLHDRRGGGHHLGHGGQIEDGIRGHGRGMGHGRCARRRPLIDDPVLGPHQDDGAGGMAGGDLLVRHLGDAGKAGRVDLVGDLGGLGNRRSGVTAGGGSTLATGGSRTLGAAAQTGKTKATATPLNQATELRKGIGESWMPL